MSNASSCPPTDVLPDTRSLPVSPVLNYVFVPGTNTSDAAMVACCAPYAVSLLAGCYEFCVLADQYTNTTEVRRAAIATFAACIKAHGSDALVGGNVSRAAPTAAGRLSLRGVALVALVAACLVMV